MGTRGKRRGAHSGVEEGVSELGDGLEKRCGRRRSRMPEVEDEGEGGVAGLPAKRGSMGRTRESRRS